MMQLRFQVSPLTARFTSFPYLSNEERNNVAICSHDCNDARNNEFLDQQRTGTIDWKSGGQDDSRNDRPISSLCNKLLEVQPLFTGNRTHLKIVSSAEFLSNPYDYNPAQTERFMEGVRFEEVTSLTVSSNKYHRMRIALRVLSLCLPNLCELHLNGSIVGLPEFHYFLEDLYRFPITLRKITGHGLFVGFQCGFAFREAINLAELYAENAAFSELAHVREVPFQSVLASDRPDDYLFMKCRRLERLSIKDATVVPESGGDPYPLPQDALIKMVRRHPTLRWLRSDLTAENVAMLKQERPEITFVLE